MSKRWLFLLAVVALWCLTASLAMAQSQPSVAPAATVAAPDPYVGGPIESKVPLARFCRDTIPSVCEGIPPGDPCDTPAGCVCGYSGGHVRCGRF
jgi:hypothetical protein